MALLITAVVFLLVVGLITLFGYRHYVLAGRVYEHLEDATVTSTASDDEATEPQAISRAAEFVATKLPPSAETASSLQLMLLAAGYRDPKSVLVLYGLKLMLAAGTTVLMILFGLASHGAPLIRILGIAVGVLAGFKLPDFFLAQRITQRKKKLRGALPDALDLTVVCAEAGLTIDRCFRNVSEHLGIAHPELSSEFRLFTVEVNAGLRRREALDNIATRTQETEIRKFVAVLTQADRFGTSMADALRTHADYLRIKRRQEAEEKASQVSVKLIFPIFFFIMPCMFLVTVGPAAISIMRQLGHLFGIAK